MPRPFVDPPRQPLQAGRQPDVASGLPEGLANVSVQKDGRAAALASSPVGAARSAAAHTPPFLRPPGLNQSSPHRDCCFAGLVWAGLNGLLRIAGGNALIPHLPLPAAVRPKATAAQVAASASSPHAIPTRAIAAASGKQPPPGRMVIVPSALPSGSALAGDCAAIPRFSAPSDGDPYSVGAAPTLRGLSRSRVCCSPVPFEALPSVSSRAAASTVWVGCHIFLPRRGALEGGV